MQWGWQSDPVTPKIRLILIRKIYHTVAELPPNIKHHRHPDIKGLQIPLLGLYKFQILQFPTRKHKNRHCKVWLSLQKQQLLKHPPVLICIKEEYFQYPSLPDIVICDITWLSPVISDRDGYTVLWIGNIPVVWRFWHTPSLEESGLF